MQKSGITLIALVVTIIVLIILAAVSLNLILGQNGIISRAQQAAKETKASAFKEKLELEMATILTNLLVEGKDINMTTVAEKLDELGYVVKTNPDGTLEIKTEDGGIATITPDLSIEVEGVPNQSGGGTPVTPSDTTPPEVQISYSTTSPISGPVIVTIEANEKIVLPPGWEAVDGTETKYTKEYTVNTTETIAIQDIAGNTKSVNVTVSNIDTTPPSNITFSPNSQTGIGTFTVTISATDMESGVSKLEVLEVLNGSALTVTDPAWNNAVSIDISGEDTKSGTYTFEPPTNGRYLYVRATDEAGNKSANISGFYANVCFVAGTKVAIVGGMANIEDLKVGDEVYTMNEYTHEIEIKKVKNTFERTTSEITRLTFANRDVIETTQSHPFYVVGKGWKEVKDLQLGDEVLTKEGEQIRIIKIQKTERPDTKVYNLSIEDNNNYFVGVSKLLVHNATVIGTCGLEDYPVST